MEFLRQNFIYIAMALVSGGLLFASSFKRFSQKNGVNPTQATMLLNRENGIIVDVRSAAEFAEGHPTDARHLPREEFESRVGELSKFKEKPVILVCQTGGKSASLVKTLENAGFARAGFLEGGLKAWAEAGLPLKKGNA